MKRALLGLFLGVGLACLAGCVVRGLHEDGSGTDSTGQTSTSAGDDGANDDGGTDHGGGGTSDDGGNTTDGGDTTSEGWTTGDGCAFIGCSDVGEGEECDTTEQDCPDGLKCTPYVFESDQYNVGKCVPIIGNKQFGDPCTRTEENDDCDRGFFCVTETYAGTGEGVCFELCSGDPGSLTCSDPEAHCPVTGNGDFLVCVLDCNPLTQDCPPTMACYPVYYGTFACYQPRPADGGGNDGDECLPHNDCLPGLACLPPHTMSDCASEDGCCTPICDLTAADPCVPPEACTGWYEEGQAPPGLESVGACMLPP